ncbi:unnamed protein product [Ectocarpus sp. CCAP 1310/34]|nr:unnamed protein product [Ectocarpus sp. CCAP 1310/34]
MQEQWYSLKQEVGEEPRRYLTRASVLRQKLEAYGWVQSDHDANVHYVRNLLPDFNVQRSVLLAQSEVKTELVEKVILTAWAATEAARKRASESVGAYALVTGGDDRGGGRGNMGDRGKTRGQRRTAAWQQQQQPQQPQQQHQPYFKQQQQVRATAEGTGPSMGAGVFLEEDVISSSRQEEDSGGVVPLPVGGAGALSTRDRRAATSPPTLYLSGATTTAPTPPCTARREMNLPSTRMTLASGVRTAVNSATTMFCPSRVDVGRPAGMPAANAPPKPPPPRPPAGGYSQRPPWAHSYGQANTAQQCGGEGVEPGTAGATVATMAAPSTGRHAVTHVTGVYQQPVTHASGVYEYPLQP